MGTGEGHKHCSRDRVRKRSAGRRTADPVCDVDGGSRGQPQRVKRPALQRKTQDPGRATNKQLPSPSKSPRAPGPPPASWSPPTGRRVGRNATALTYRRNHVTAGHCWHACAWAMALLPRRPCPCTPHRHRNKPGNRKGRCDGRPAALPLLDAAEGWRAARVSVAVAQCTVRCCVVT